MKTTEENNRMIAEFMGINKNDNGTYELPQFGSLRPNGDFKTEFEIIQLKYHTSWDWLMPVVIKLHDENNINCMRFDINNTYNSVVKFIEWYNENK